MHCNRGGVPCQAQDWTPLDRGGKGQEAVDWRRGTGEARAEDRWVRGPGFEQEVSEEERGGDRTGDSLERFPTGSRGTGILVVDRGAIPTDGSRTGSLAEFGHPGRTVWRVVLAGAESEETSSEIDPPPSRSPVKDGWQAITRTPAPFIRPGEGPSVQLADRQAGSGPFLSRFSVIRSPAVNVPPRSS